jgi:hypothetical protein
MGNICRVCNSFASKRFTSEILDLTIQYFECTNCGYLQTESPFWLEQAYNNAINDSDTGILWRNRINSHIVIMTILSLGITKDLVVDFAGGYGLLVRELRDYGVNALWRDEYCTNLVAKGFEHMDESAALVTAFEVFEHFVNPMESLELMLSFAPSVLLSTEILPTPAPLPDKWWYYGQEHGQHIGFFRIQTLINMTDRLGYRLLTDGKKYHLITRHSLPGKIWNLLIKSRLLAPFLIRLFLESRTIRDHELIVSSITCKKHR